jgi:hypothetical protein
MRQDANFKDLVWPISDALLWKEQADLCWAVEMTGALRKLVIGSNVLPSN